MAATTTFQLTTDTTIDDAAGALRAGLVPLEAFLEWQAGYVKRQSAASGRVRVTVSPKGMIVLNGVVGKGEGFAPNFTPRVLADLLDNADALIGAVVENADKSHAADATVKDLNPAWKKAKDSKASEEQLAKIPKLVPVAHPRAGKPVLKYGSAAELAETVKRLQAIRAKLVG